MCIEEITELHQEAEDLAEHVQKPEMYIFSCLGFGLVNMARRTD